MRAWKDGGESSSWRKEEAEAERGLKVRVAEQADSVLAAAVSAEVAREALPVLGRYGGREDPGAAADADRPAG
jgi:hypothetical protein